MAFSVLFNFELDRRPNRDTPFLVIIVILKVFSTAFIYLLSTAGKTL